MQVDYVVVGGGYAGLMCGKSLIEKGFDVLIFEMKEIGGELSVFAKLSEFREKYEEYISEVEQLKKEVNVEKGTVIKSKPVIVSAENGLRRLEARKIVLCTGASDRIPPKLNIISKRISGIYTLDNALRMVANEEKLGKRVLLTGSDRILELAETQFCNLGYDTELIELEGDIKIIGKNKIEGVEIAGNEYRCDTLIICNGREPFNPLKLKGLPVGNVSACTYDYSKVEKNVKKFISNL